VYIEFEIFSVDMDWIVVLLLESIHITDQTPSLHNRVYKGIITSSDGMEVPTTHQQLTWLSKQEFDKSAVSTAMKKVILYCN